MNQARATVGVEHRRAVADREQGSATAGDEDVRVAALRTAVVALRHQLALLPPDFPDRAIAEDELELLAAMTTQGVPELPRLHRSLLLIAAAVGSVSTLSRGLADVRHAVERFGAPHRP